MENQETNSEQVLTNQELKQKHWKSIKNDFMKLIPKQYKVELEGMEKNDQYYHPIVRISEEIYLKGQCDLDNSNIYAVSLLQKSAQIIGCLVYQIVTYMDNDQIEFVLNNFKMIEPKIKEVFLQIQKINHFNNLLNEIRNDLIYQTIFNIVDIKKKKETLQTLYSVTEFVENERFLTK